MVTHIIIPLPQRSEFKLQDYASLYSHLPEKKFSLLPLMDFIRGKKKSTTDQDRELFEEKVVEEAKDLQTDINIVRSQSSLESLLNLSCFADLVSLQVVTGKSLENFTSVFTDNILGKMNCALLISPFTSDVFEEIMILGDYDQSIVTAIKSFNLLFDKASRHRRVTVLTPTPDDELSIVFEQDLIAFIRKSFHDVGIVPIKADGVDKQLVSIASKMDKPLLILGHKHQDLIFSSEMRSLIVAKKLSLFYSN